MNEDKMETMELAVREQAQELTRISQEIGNITESLNLLRKEITSFSEKLNNHNVAVNTDTRPIQKILDGALLNMTHMVERALNKVRTNVWQLYFQMNGTKWTVVLLVILTFLFFAYNLWFHSISISVKK
jgi:hypothetical protein